MKFLLLFIYLISSSTLYAVNIYDMEEDEVLSNKAYAKSVMRTYEKHRRAKLKTYADASQQCKATKAYIEQVLRRIHIFSELHRYEAKQYPSILRMACEKGGERQFVSMDYGVLNFGIHILPHLKSEDHLAALLALEMSWYLHAYDQEAIKLGDSVLSMRGIRLRYLRNKMLKNIDTTALRVLMNAGYDGYALIEVIEIRNQVEDGRIGGRSFKIFGGTHMKNRRVALQNFLMKHRVMPAKQAAGKISLVQQEVSAILASTH